LTRWFDIFQPRSDTEKMTMSLKHKDTVNSKVVKNVTN